MNRIVITARIAKGISENQVAEKLGITESVYNELELEITAVTPAIAEKLETLYAVPAEYFMVGGFNNIKIGIDAMEQAKKIIANTDFPSNLSVPAHTHISMVKMGLDALIAKQEQILLLKQNQELERENDALRTLYNNAKANT
ncbi:MAG TPA: helix-turn-helix transcriptional regulator [Niabella sp.]|nr:helix-turn-helix transcriptional regulator [Niabella sp.]